HRLSVFLRRLVVASLRVEHEAEVRAYLEARSELDGRPEQGLRGLELAVEDVHRRLVVEGGDAQGPQLDDLAVEVLRLRKPPGADVERGLRVVVLPILRAEVDRLLEELLRLVVALQREVRPRHLPARGVV